MDGTVGGAAESGQIGAQFGYSVGGGWGAAIGGAIGTITGGIFGRKRKKQRKRLERLQRQATAMQRDVQRKTMVRDSMMAMAGVDTQWSATGVGKGSSGVEGTKASTQSQTIFNLGYLKNMNKLSNDIGNAQAKMAKGDFDTFMKGLLGGQGGSSIAAGVKGIGGAISNMNQNIPAFAKQNGGGVGYKTYDSGIEGVDYFKSTFSKM